jgi:hypothetical protein
MLLGSWQQILELQNKLSGSCRESPTNSFNEQRNSQQYVSFVFKTDHKLATMLHIQICVLSGSRRNYLEARRPRSLIAVHVLNFELAET